MQFGTSLAARHTPLRHLYGYMTNMAAEREEGNVMIIPDAECAAGMTVKWGFGNKMLLYASRGPLPPETDKPYGAKDVRLHELKWDTVMHSCLVRPLVNESHAIFMSLQSKRLAVGETGTRPELVKFSRGYRSVIHACILELKKAGNSTLDEEEAAEHAALSCLFYETDLVWSICEIFFIEQTPGGVILPKLLEWVRWHFHRGEQLLQELLQSVHDEESTIKPELHENYWPAVYSFVLQGRLVEARKLLSLHLKYKSEPFQSMGELLCKMPIYNGLTGCSVQEFELTWQRWQDECYRRLEDGEFITYKELETVAKILCGDEGVFVDMKDQCETWYHMLISRLLYTNPAVKGLELQYHTQACIDAYGGNLQLGAVDHILLSAIEYDVYQVISDSSTHLSWWFAAHLTDLLRAAGQLDDAAARPAQGGAAGACDGDLRESLLLDYAASLTAHPSLWRVAADYFDHCPQYGRHYLERYLERIPLETERKAQKVIRMCEEREMTELASSICKVMGMRAFHEGQLGSALSWCLRSKDASFAAFISDKFLSGHMERGDLSHLDMLDNLGPSTLFSSSLTFLGKYREFHRLYESNDMKGAASLLLSLLTCRLAPRKFWLNLLVDVVPLLEMEPLLFSSNDTYELLHLLEDVQTAQRLQIEGSTRRGIESDSKAETRRKGASSNVEKEKLDLLRLALAKNLARSFIVEGSLAH
ncbi:PREDICTED: nuclear pore complex protein Nup85-like [Priapulus caudatus]|uniref:Nuclear pore complex protein Nup85 n=1 Tax=Priapulus caudatus TaxID=37621 RepID=A0ABM1DUB3_PRICU|nr:PREDICTED: nuclear pore complex protein Nup85-like [Priapulus caudatus]